jgi:hypothetical protein
MFFHFQIMVKLGTDHTNYVIELYYKIQDKANSLTLNNDLLRLFLVKYPQIDVSYSTLYNLIRVFKVNSFKTQIHYLILLIYQIIN